MDRRGQSSHKLHCLLLHLQVAVTSLNPGPSTQPPHPTASPPNPRPCPPPFSPGSWATQTQAAWRTVVPKQTGGPLEVPPTSSSQTSPMPGVEKMPKNSLLDSGIYKCRNCGWEAGAACTRQSARMASGSIPARRGGRGEERPPQQRRQFAVCPGLTVCLSDPRFPLLLCDAVFSQPSSPSSV